MPPGFADAVHIAHGDSAAEALRVAGAGTVHVARDLLTCGPCDVDPARHVELRLRHWRLDAAHAPDFALQPAWPEDRPIVLWATRAWSDQLCLWWALDRFARAGVDPARLWWAAPRTHHRLASCGAATEAALADALAAAQPITPAFAAAAARLWQAYASPSPLAFDEARRGGVPELPDLGAIAEPHGGWFPRRLAGQPRPSVNDELLRSHLDRPLDVPELLYPYGDLFILQRRNQLRAGTLEPLHVGGCRVDDWVREDGAGGWHLRPRD